LFLAIHFETRCALVADDDTCFHKGSAIKATTPDSPVTDGGEGESDYLCAVSQAGVLRADCGI